MLLFLGIFVTLLGPSVAAEPSYVYVSVQANSISGHVSNDRGSPISDLNVELLNDVDSVIQRTKTDSSGLFTFRRLTTGIFEVRIQSYGSNYISQTKRVQLERTRAFEQVDFVLVTSHPTPTTTTVAAIFVQEVPEPARKEYERGVSLIHKTDQRNEGMESLKKAIELFPLYFDALELLGTEYVKLQEYETAIPVLTKAIEVNGRAYPSLNALSVAQYNLKQLPEAVESMRRAITFNQKSINANLWLGMLLRQTNKLDEAETYLKQADQLAASKSPDAHWQLALLFNQLKRYKEAADELELFLKVQPDSKDTELIKKLIEKFRKQSAGGMKPVNYRSQIFKSRVNW
ncbi:MAG TPA: tetratricopeptide repeat protein [Pyrinomonadaceae bacterium]|jgi:tetratricopeptide (TPR) repeat protein|nr:tetratricopeptide repeat protein [Pyrinomonadaceae bacterium]